MRSYEIAKNGPKSVLDHHGYSADAVYPHSGFMHIDLGPTRSWGEPFAPRATPIVPETLPAREVLADSRTLKGGGAVGIATVGVEVAQDVLAETQSAILPLVPYYLDTLRGCSSPWR
jgi:hypothetical protein